MDENYLDNLLNEISLDKEIDHNIEDELDSQMRKEKRKRQAESEVTKKEALDLEIENESFDMFDSSDLQFSEKQMDELDALDNLADLDIGDLDFADIDFDDVDVTRLDDFDDSGFDDLLKDFEGDLQIDDFFNRGEKDDAGDVGKDDALADEKEEASGEMEVNIKEDDVQNLESSGENGVKKEKSDELSQQEIQDLLSSLANDNNQEELNEDTFDANAFLDSLLDESQETDITEQDVEELPEHMGEPERKEENVLEEIPDKETEEKEESFEDSLEELLDTLEENPNEAVSENKESEDLEEIPDLDDLLSMLDMDESAENSGVELGKEEHSETDSNENLSDAAALLNELDGLDGIEELKETPVKKKRTLMQILFGDPDDADEISTEELEAAEAKKAAKKAAKAAKKEAAKNAKKEKAESDKAKKSLANDKKKKALDEKNRLKAEKKAKKKAEAAAEAAAAEPEKKLNKPIVLFIFTLFLGGLFVLYTGMNNFNYTQAIEKAANYFANQKYRRAYDEIVGVEVKEKDQDLKDRIYTVMYVERLYESYNNNIAMGHKEKALDSLLRGVTKYYEHYEEAQELGIVNDLDYSFQQIIEALQSNYGISVEQAIAINELENLQYVQTIQAYVEGQEPPTQDAEN